MAGGPIAYDGKRAWLQHLAVRADQAVSVSGMQVALTAPRLYPHAPAVGLASVAFAHEDGFWRNVGSGREGCQDAVDALDRADALLEKRAKEERQKRRSLFYWADRVLRAVLGFPAYLITRLGV